MNSKISPKLNLPQLFKNGLELLHQGQSAKAQSLFLQVLSVHPNHFDSLHLLGLIAARDKKPELALEWIGRAINVNPKDASVHYNYGVALAELNFLDDAVASYRYAIKLRPEYFDAIYNLGNVLKECRRYEEAIDCYKRAINLKPQDANAYCNLGNLFKEINRYDESLACYEIAITINPNNADVYCNLGIVLKDLKRIDEAINCYDHAICLKPNLVDAYWNKSTALLTAGDFEKGWELYNWRWKNKKLKFKEWKFKQPMWSGEALPLNKTLLLYNEQGIGEQILFASLLLNLTRLVANIKIVIDPRLVPLLKRSLPTIEYLDSNVNIEEINFDFQLPIGDLGKFFRKSMRDFDASRHQFMYVDLNRAKKLRANAIKKKTLLCGITWNSKNKDIGISKSVRLQDFLPLFKLQDISFVSLQYDASKQDINEFNQMHNTEIYFCEEVDNFNDLDGHAALIHACDFIVSISNTTAHLAGAIGKKTYLLYPSGVGALWYWANQVDQKSVWYPNVEIFQQSNFGSWFEPITNIVKTISTNLNDLK